MKRLSGIKIHKLDFTPLKQGDLLYYEGPLLSVFSDSLSNNLYFYKWSDCDETAHRWLVFKTPIAALKAFFDKKQSLRGLILEQPFAYCLDLNHELMPINIVVLSSPNIPKSYLPDADSFYDAADYESYAFDLQLKVQMMVMPKA